MKKLLLLTCVSAFLLSSCVSYNHSYRKTDVGNTSIGLAGPYVADLDIDFTKTVTAVSGKHATKGAAKDEAYYNAITKNNIHVVVDPIYSVRTMRTLFGSICIAEITGFTGMYKDARKKSDDGLAKESELFNARFESLEKLAGLKSLTEEEENVYSVKSGGCCGDGDKSSSAGPTLLTTTTNKTGLIDSYNKIVGNSSSEKSTNTVAVSAGAPASDSDDEKKSGFLSKILNKLMFWQK
jgi:hypothetical protein